MESTNKCITTDYSYEGVVGYSLSFNNKPVKTVHNAGTKELQKAFAMFMSDNTLEASRYVPKKLNILYGGVPILFSPIQLTGSRYDQQDKDWVAIHNAIIDVSDIKTKVPERTKCTLQLLGEGNMILADCMVDSSETICLISHNVSGLITWMMRLKL